MIFPFPFQFPRIYIQKNIHMDQWRRKQIETGGGGQTYQSPPPPVPTPMWTQKRRQLNKLEQCIIYRMIKTMIYIEYQSVMNCFYFGCHCTLLVGRFPSRTMYHQVVVYNSVRLVNIVYIIYIIMVMPGTNKHLTSFTHFN